MLAATVWRREGIRMHTEATLVQAKVRGSYLRTTKGALSTGREKLRMTMAGCLADGETPLAKTRKGEWERRI